MPLTWGEKADAFVRFRQRLHVIYDRDDVFGQGLYNDLITSSAFVDRVDRWVAELRADAHCDGLRLALRDDVDAKTLSHLVAGCRRGDPDILADAGRRLSRLGLTFDQAAAMALSSLPGYAQVARLRVVSDRQMKSTWRRLDASRNIRYRATHFAQTQQMRENAKAGKTGQARPARPDPSSTDGVPSAIPLTAENGEDPDAVDPGLGLIPSPPGSRFERPDWVGIYERLKDDLPPLGPHRDIDCDYLYTYFNLSICPTGVVQDRIVRSAVQVRIEAVVVERSVVDLVAAAHSAALLAALRELAPDEDHGALMAAYRVDPAVQARVEAILAPAGLTLALLEARGVLREIKSIARLHRRLVETQERSVEAEKALEDGRADDAMRPYRWPQARRERTRERDVQLL